MAKAKTSTTVIRKTESITTVKIPVTVLREVLANAGYAPEKGVVEIFIGAQDACGNIEEVEVDDNRHVLQIRYVVSDTTEETK
jgi:hypothetical protein